MKLFLGLASLALLGLISLILIRTLLMTSKQIAPGDRTSVSFPRQEAADRMASSIRFRTPF